MSDDVRSYLAAVIRERGEDFSSLSRLIGRNPAYIQQFIKRGTPQKLDEEDRRVLAAYLRVPEDRLGGRATAPLPIVLPAQSAAARRVADMILVPRLEVRASAGPGAEMVSVEEQATAMAFAPGLLRELASGNVAALSLIRVMGDSMVPTLGDGDDILVDRDDAADRLRDGIYVLRVDGQLIVKRLALHPGGRGFTIRSDNPHYPDRSDYDPVSDALIGRVVWTARRLR